MIILTNYKIRKRNGIYYAIADEMPVCPICQSRLTVRDSKRRQVIMENGQVRTFLLRRLKCSSCKVIHMELPDLFVPYKRYSRQVIHMALTGATSNCPAENSTIYRWNKQHISE